MSKFFKALEQAQRDRQTSPSREPIPPVAPAPVPPAPVASARVEPAPRGPSFPRPDRVPDPTPRVEAPLGPSQGVDEHLVSLLTPAAFEAEQYRSLRLTVEQMRRKTPLQVIAVTSAAVGDGKSTTAINLAGALAQSRDANILLVDADLRRPALGRLLGIGHTGSPGLVNGITNAAIGLEQLIERRPPFNLAIIRAGATPPSPYEILKSPRLGELLDQARDRFDYIIVDCPPLVPVQDCRVIGQWMDGFLLVVQAHHTPRRMVEEALNVIDTSKMIGLVFNADDHMVSGFNSRYYAGYYARPAPESANGHPAGRLRSVMKKAGESLRRTRRSQ